MSACRLLIADDHEAVRLILKLVTEAECEIVGETANGRDTIDAVDRLRPDLLILDVSLPDMSGIEVARLVRERMPALLIILHTQHSQRVFVDEARRLGMNGYVLKGAATRDIPLAIREALAGRFFASSAPLA